MPAFSLICSTSMRLITPETVKSLRLTAQTMSEIHSYTCASICRGLRRLDEKLFRRASMYFFTSSSVIVFLLSARDEDSLWGGTSSRFSEILLKYEPLAATISSISFSLILYGFVFFLSMLSITMIYTLIPCDNWAFCKADVPDGGLSSYSAKKKRINVGKDTLSVIVIYRHE